MNYVKLLQELHEDWWRGRALEEKAKAMGWQATGETAQPVEVYDVNCPPNTSFLVEAVAPNSADDDEQDMPF